MVTQPSILAWKIPWTVQWSLAGYSPRGRKEWDTTEHTWDFLKHRCDGGAEMTAILDMRCPWGWKSYIKVVEQKDEGVWVLDYCEASISAMYSLPLDLFYSWERHFYLT